MSDSPATRRKPNRVFCESCSLDEAFRTRGSANARAGTHYVEFGHVATVEDEFEGDDRGVASVCTCCGWFYHHGDRYVDERRADQHRTHGGDRPARNVDEEDREPHSVAVIDLANAEVLLEPTRELQNDPSTATTRVEDLRGD